MSTNDDIKQAHDVVLPEDEEEQEIETPEEEGESGVSGSEAGLDSDDNVDEMTDEVGLYDKEGETEEVNIAEQIERDEEARGDIPPDK